TEVTPAANGSDDASAAQPELRSAAGGAHRPAAVLPHVAADRAAAVHRLVIDWYRANARPLPWRDPTASAWASLGSDVLSPQTPVVRVRRPWSAWMQRWPTPADLAAAAASAVLTAWDALGYPRRARRLQETATAIAKHHDTVVPHDEATPL